LVQKTGINEVEMRYDITSVILNDHDLVNNEDKNIFKNAK